MRTRTIRIFGGNDKVNDYNEIESVVKEKVKALVFMGVDNSKLHEFFDYMNIPTKDAGSMEEAVSHCKEFAKDGDTVLLSPCCASFDLFNSYEDRGDQFKKCVKNLK